MGCQLSVVRGPLLKQKGAWGDDKRDTFTMLYAHAFLGEQRSDLFIQLTTDYGQLTVLIEIKIRTAECQWWYGGLRVANPL